MDRSNSGNRKWSNTYYGRIPLGPIDPFSCARENNLDKVLYRYPKGITTSYGANFNHKEQQRTIPFVNMNTYKYREYPHKLDSKTINQLDYGDTSSTLKLNKGATNIIMPEERSYVPFRSTYGEQYPNWGKPEYYHFKRNEPRITSDKLAFHAETTYGKSFGKDKSKSPIKMEWKNVKLRFYIIIL